MIRAFLLLSLALPRLLRADLATQIQAQLQPFEVLHGSFQQSKKIAMLEHPLLSSGHFVIVRRQGVLWMSEKPFASCLRLDKNGIRQIRDGQIAFELKSQDEPLLRLINSVLLSLFSAEIASVLPHFELSGSFAQGHWEALLKPKDAWMAKVASRIHVRGGKTLEAMTLKEANGDVTEIHFSALDLASPLSPREKELFQ